MKNWNADRERNCRFAFIVDLVAAGFGLAVAIVFLAIGWSIVPSLAVVALFLVLASVDYRSWQNAKSLSWLDGTPQRVDLKGWDGTFSEPDKVDLEKHDEGRD